MCCPSTHLLPPWGSLFKIRRSDGAVIWWAAKGLMQNTGTVARDSSARTRSVIAIGDRIYEIGGGFSPSSPRRSLACREDLGPTYDSFFDSAASGIENSGNLLCGVLNTSGNRLWLPSMSGLRVFQFDVATGECVFEKAVASGFGGGNVGDGITLHLKESNPERWLAAAPSDGFINCDNSGGIGSVRAYNGSATSVGTLANVRQFCDHDGDHFVCVREVTSPRYDMTLEKRLKTNPSGSPIATFSCGVGIPNNLSSNGTNISLILSNGTAIVLDNDLNVVAESADPTFSMTSSGTTPYLTATGTDCIYLLFNKYSTASDGRLLVRKITDDGLEWSRTLNTVDISNTFYFVTRIVEVAGVVYLSGWWKDVDTGKIMNVAALDAETGAVIWQRRVVNLDATALQFGSVDSPGLHFTLSGDYLFLACNGKVKVG